jgi:RNA polymerase sigma-70 factor (ECF subfamily)
MLPTEPEVAGLLALMLLTDARRTARVADGVLVPLADQDRRSWDGAEISEGLELVRECLAVTRPGVYQIQAAVNAVHTSARTSADTDWSQVAALYGQLLALAPSPVIALNRAVAVAELDGPAVGLAEVDRLDLPTYHLWHATRAELLRRLDRRDDARAAYDAALALTDNDAERKYLVRKRDSL